MVQCKRRRPMQLILLKTFDQSRGSFIPVSARIGNWFVFFHPFLEREGEAHLRAVPDLFGQEVFEGIHQQGLAFISAELDILADRENELHQVLVKEGNTDLDAMAHAHVVYVFQELVLHVKVGLQPAGAVAVAQGAELRVAGEISQ